MAKVVFSDQALADLGRLTNPMLARVQAIVERLVKWPDVAGKKPLRGDLKGCFRLRTGDWRVVVRPVGDVVWVVRIDNRRDVYED